MAFKGNKGGVAFDAAGSSGMAFLTSQLEFAEPTLIKPLTSMTHPRDITVKTGGGFVEFMSAYSADYAGSGGGVFGLQGTNNTDIPEVQVNIQKGVWRAWNWAQSFVITLLDLERLNTAKQYGMTPPFSLQSMLEDGVQLIWNKALERVTYLGWLGQPGLVNNPNVTSSIAPATGTGSSTTWASKTPGQILADINFGLTATIAASAYSMEGLADTLLLPWTQYQLLMQPMTTGGFSSILEYVLQNNIGRQNGVDFKILPVANPWISGQGVGGRDRAMFYRNDEKVVMLRIPQPIRKALTVPTTRSGGAYETIYNGCIGQVQWFRTQPAYYLDGI